MLRRGVAVPALPIALAMALLPTGTAGAGATPAQPAPGQVSAAAASVASPLRSSRARISALAVSDVVGGLLDVSSGRQLPPASTIKLLTVGTAFALLGPERTLVTTITTTAAAGPDGSVAGDLVLTGAGDPTLTRRDLRAMAVAAAKAGVRTVRGHLVLDPTLFDSRRGAPGWRPDYVGFEAGPLSAIMVDHNLWRGDRAFRRNPLPATAKLLRASLKAAGVEVLGSDLIARPTAAQLPLVAHSSKTLRVIAKHTLQCSDNTEAEMLLKLVGAVALGNGTTRGGLAAVHQVATSWGVSLRGQLFDGSGLSVADRLDARSMVSWLQALDTQGLGELMRSALPVSCRSGTLKQRLCGAWLSGRTIAKTGTLDHTAAIAGWTTTRSGRPVVFAATVDGPWATVGAAALYAAIARLMRLTI